MQGAQIAPLLGYQQTSTGIAIKPMYKLKIAAISPGRPQRLNDTKAPSTAPMDRYPWGLVKHQKTIVFVQYALCQVLSCLLGNL